jgi:hypothetical protein
MGLFPANGNPHWMSPCHSRFTENSGPFTNQQAEEPRSEPTPDLQLQEDDVFGSSRPFSPGKSWVGASPAIQYGKSWVGWCQPRTLVRGIDNRQTAGFSPGGGFATTRVFKGAGLQGLRESALYQGSASTGP